MIVYSPPFFSRLPRLPRGTKGASRGHSLVSSQYLSRSCANSQNHNPFLFRRFRTLLKILFPASPSDSVPCALFAQNTRGRGYSILFVTSLLRYFITPRAPRTVRGSSIPPPVSFSDFDFQLSTFNVPEGTPVAALTTSIPSISSALFPVATGRVISSLFVTSLRLYFITSLPGRRCATRHSLLPARARRIRSASCAFLRLRLSTFDCSTPSRSHTTERPRAKILELTAVELG